MRRAHRSQLVLAASVAVLATGLAAQVPRREGPAARVAQSADVAWLERLAASPAFAREVQGDARAGAPKLLRVAAYARLGAIGSTESLAAVARINRDMAAAPLTPATVALDVWSSIAWHMSDAEFTDRSRVTAPPRDGVTYAVVEATLLGGRDLFLVSTRTPNDAASWSRPKLAAPSTGTWDAETATLAWRGPRTLVFAAPGRTVQIALDEIERDSDGDGWTDLEEARIGTNPHSADSDADGIPDGRDVCPLYAAPPGSDEPAEILQAAVFGAFAMTGSRDMLYVTPQTPRVHLAGYGGPVLFDRAIPRGGEGDGATFVSWKISSRTGNDAVVQITDWEGMLAGGGQDVTLKRTAGRWVVVAVRSTWVS